MRAASAFGCAVLILFGGSGCTSSEPRPGHQPPPHSTDTITLPADTGEPTASGTTNEARTATVLGSGDVLIHPPLWIQAHRDAHAEGRNGYDFGPMYASIAPDVEAADLAICEMETPLAPPQGPFVGWPTFSAPPQVLTALTGVGYDSCTTASNHTLDSGYPGLQRTLNELDAAGLQHTGSARSAQEAATPLIITLPNGIKIGQLAYSFNFNGFEPPPDKRWEANLIDVPTILSAAKRIKQAGADIVVVSMHWGIEYEHLATQEQRDQARRLLRSPNIDLILGDHPHVVEPAEKIAGKWVFYCMGNQISRHEDPIPDSREGVMPEVTFTETRPDHFRATSVVAVPTWMQDVPDLRLLDIPRVLASSTATPRQLREASTARARIVHFLDAYGALADGLVVP